MKKIFVHIPKTAGTFINGSLIASGKPTLVHCESCINSSNFHSIIQDYEWISGHVSMGKFKKIISKLNIEVEYYSLLRHPLRQLVSQICWQIEICSKKDNNHRFLKNHPAKAIHRILQTLFCDLNDMSSINNLISRNPGYLSNNQAMYLMSEYGININLNYQSMSKSDYLEFLRKFRHQCFDMFGSIKFLGSDQNINNALKNFGVTDLSRTRYVDKNKSQLYINPELIQRPEFIKGLIIHNLLDCILYLSYLESISDNTCKIINMNSIDSICGSIFEYISPSFSYDINSYDPKKQLDIQISIAQSLKRKDENLKIKSYANKDIQISIAQSLKRKYENLKIKFYANRGILISGLLNSTSLKITKPLRNLSRKYKKSIKFAKNFLKQLKAFKKRLF